MGPTGRHKRKSCDMSMHQILGFYTGLAWKKKMWLLVPLAIPHKMLHRPCVFETLPEPQLDAWKCICLPRCMPSSVYVCLDPFLCFFFFVLFCFLSIILLAPIDINDNIQGCLRWHGNFDQGSIEISLDVDPWACGDMWQLVGNTERGLCPWNQK